MLRKDCFRVQFSDYRTTLRKTATTLVVSFTLINWTSNNMIYLSSCTTVSSSWWSRAPRSLVRFAISAMYACSSCVFKKSHKIYFWNVISIILNFRTQCLVMCHIFEDNFVGFVLEPLMSNYFSITGVLRSLCHKLFSVLHCKSAQNSAGANSMPFKINTCHPFPQKTTKAISNSRYKKLSCK